MRSEESAYLTHQAPAAAAAAAAATVAILDVHQERPDAVKSAVTTDQRHLRSFMTKLRITN